MLSYKLRLKLLSGRVGQRLAPGIFHVQSW